MLSFVQTLWLLCHLFVSYAAINVIHRFGHKAQGDNEVKIALSSHSLNN
jgi:hypothetical protein